MRAHFDSILFYRTTLISFVVSLLLICFGFAVIDFVHPRLPCFEFEKKAWANFPAGHSLMFKRVSSRFWSSLCRPESSPVMFSASEGTGLLMFSDSLFSQGVVVDQFTEAHRGIKAAGYLLAHKIHPDRRKNLKMIIGVNPIYFSAFAAQTDAASVRLISLSTMSFLWRVPTLHLKWNEFLPLSPFIGAKEYLHEVSPFFRAEIPVPHYELKARVAPEVPPAENYDPERNMFKTIRSHFTTFKSKTSAEQKPTRQFWNLIAQAAAENNVCVVMFPLNTKNLRYFKHDADQIRLGIEKLLEDIPPAKRLNLMEYSEQPYIFSDPMHFTDYGKWLLSERIAQSSCLKQVRP